MYNLTHLAENKNGNQEMRNNIQELFEATLAGIQARIQHYVVYVRRGTLHVLFQASIVRIFMVSSIGNTITGHRLPRCGK